jgi:predicted nucleic acid-binding protein
MPVLDASVYIALINAQETDLARCWTWFERVQGTGELVVAPLILLTEVAAAVSRGMGDLELAHRGVGQLRSSPAIELLPVTRSMATRAARTAGDDRIRGCDSVYVALADQLNEFPVTLDSQQLEGSCALSVALRP